MTEEAKHILRQDLIRAKALINTPEAFERLGVVGAFNAALTDKYLYGKGIALLRRCGGLSLPYGGRRHEAALALFDRAIEAAS